MLIYLFQVTVCLAFFYGLYFFGLRKETMFHTNRMYLMITLIMSLILPFVKIYIDGQLANTNRLVASTVYLGNYVNNFSTSISRPEVKTIPWIKILTGLYLLGAVVMSVRLLLAFKQILDIRKTGIHTMVSGHLCILSDSVKSPFSFFNTIYLPSQHSFSEVELNEVIVHEKAHVSGMHTWDVILMELLCIKLWPSPMIYLYRKSLKEVHEFVADAAVVKDTPWENYAQLLVSQQHSQLQNILSNQLIYSQLKKRLLMMNKKRSGFTARYKYLGCIPLILMALVFFSFREKPLSGQEFISTFQADTLPESSVIALRLTEPVQAPTISEDNTELDYTLPMPIFPGCDDVPIRDRGNCGMEKLGEYINAHMVYPESLKKSGKEGRVLVKFVVDANGYIKDVAIQQSLDPAADQAVLDLVNGMNANAGKWRPARKEGKSFDAEMVLPVTFKLQDTKNEIKPETVSGTEPYSYVEEMPRFNGCEDITDPSERFTCTMGKLYAFIGNNIQYPAEDREKKIEGQGVVQFVVEANGSLTDIRVVRSPSSTITTEIMRMMNVMASIPDAWIPGKQDGIAVPVRFTLPVKFKLEDEQQEKVEAPGSASKTGELNSIRVTPNPAQEFINVSYVEGTYILKIFDTSGNLVLAKEIASRVAGEETISISALKPGQYVIQVISDTKTISSSFVKI